MTGVAFVYGACWSCGQLFTFNPNWVPSVPIDPVTRLPLDLDEHGNKREVDPEAVKRAIREPLCEDCVERMNEGRRSRGEEPIKVSPYAYEASDPSGW